MSEASPKTVNVSDNGQIAIPREIQTQLGIKKGDKLVLITRDKKILIQKTVSSSFQIEDDFKDLLKLSEETAEKLWDNEEDEVWNKV